MSLQLSKNYHDSGGGNYGYQTYCGMRGANIDIDSRCGLIPGFSAVHEDARNVESIFIFDSRAKTLRRDYRISAPREAA
jgi:hypothetical protein